MDEIAGEVERLTRYPKLTGAQERRRDELADEFEAVDQQGTRLRVGAALRTSDLGGLSLEAGSTGPRWAARPLSRGVVGGSGLTTPLLDDSSSPPRLLGKPAHEASFMDATVTATANDYLAVYGDFSNHVIADRIGTVVELIPLLLGANRRPTGQRGWYMERRVGASTVNNNAFRMLNKSA